VTWTAHESLVEKPRPTLREKRSRADPEARLRQLVEANLAVGSERSLDEVLRKTVETAARLVAARYATLAILDRTGSHVERLVTPGIDDTTRARIGGVPGDVLAVPIVVRGIVYGDLYLAEKEEGRFTEADEELVTLLAAQTGITIERMQVHEEAVRWVRELEALDELTRSFLEGWGDVSRVLELVAGRLRHSIRAREVLISIPASSGDLRVAAADGESARGLIGYDLPSEANAERVLERRTSEQIDSVLDDPEFDQAVAGRVGGMAALLVPLVVGGKAIGVISAFDKQGPDPRFTDDDRRLAEALAARAALAVQVSARAARETVNAIIEAQECERSRIARELHDETGSVLTGVLLGLGAIDAAATLPEAREASTALRETARSTLESVGRLAFALRPSALDEFGLAHALRDLSGRLEEQGGPKVELEVDRLEEARLPARLETVVYRITQEALTNIVKHAKAETVHVSFACRDRSVVFRIEDDGCGMSLARMRDGGRGLVGMRERVASVNGRLEVESNGAGTQLLVEIPLA
jgi:signal transduction histidine kinase